LIVLDTHAWLWWLSDPGKLSRRASSAIDASLGAAAVYVSSISAWEVTLLVRKGRLTLRMPVEEWIARSEGLAFVRFVPVDNRIAVRSNSLAAPIHDDPADRMIVATALALGAGLVTKDQRLRRYRHVKTIW
jgi:PIN domain nuclease of toxin-antitoxin system